MGLLAALGLGKAAGEAVAAPIEAVGNVLDKLFTSDEEKAAATLVLEKLKLHPAELQVELNKTEALHRSWFVAGWRPYIGWVCGTSLAFYYIPQFAIASVIWVIACWNTGAVVQYPVTEIGGLLELVGLMLGIGVLRTIEKTQGVTK